MKLQPDKFDVSVISGYGPGWVAVNGERVNHSLVLSSFGTRRDWGCTRFEDLGSTHFAPLAELGPELVIFGSGTRLRFPKPEWLQALIARRIGVETMDTAAACRTSNILAGEGRSVVVAVLQENEG